MAILSIVLVNCSNDDDNSDSTLFNAKVLYKGADCGDTFLIQFNSDVVDIPENSTENVFYAINLPDQYKVNGLDISIDFREPYDTEILACTMQDFGYPQIFIEQVNE